MNKLLLLSLGTLALSSCATLMTAPAAYSFKPQPTAPAGVTPSGSATVRKTSDNTMTTINLSGLAANTYYVAHYHRQGTASEDPCLSGGVPIMASKMVGMSDGVGMATLSGSVMNTAIDGATYLNVHTASDSAGTPADSGVACTPVNKQ